MQYIASIYYIGDPMCSWCWGFAPEITKLKEKYRDKLDFKIMLGGLRPKTQKPMSEKQKQYLQKHWQEIKELTQQNFSFDLLERQDFVYDTEPASRAVVCIRNISPAIELDFFKAIQKAFYVDNQDTNRLDTYLDLCDEFFISREEFEEKFKSSEIQEQTQDEFEQARMLGVMGFPTVLLKIRDKYKPIARGYERYRPMETRVMEYLAKFENI